MSYFAWKFGEPDHKGGKEDCVQMSPDATWSDILCNKKLTFACQWSAGSHWDGDGKTDFHWNDIVTHEIGKGD